MTLEKALAIVAVLFFAGLGVFIYSTHQAGGEILVQDQGLFSVSPGNNATTKDDEKPNSEAALDTPEGDAELAGNYLRAVDLNGFALSHPELLLRESGKDWVSTRIGDDKGLIRLPNLANYDAYDMAKVRRSGFSANCFRAADLEIVEGVQDVMLGESWPLRVRCVTGNGTPVAEAFVAVDVGDLMEYDSKLTDDNGFADFYDLPRTRLWLRAHKKGVGATASFKEVEIPHEKDVTLTLSSTRERELVFVSSDKSSVAEVSGVAYVTSFPRGNWSQMYSEGSVDTSAPFTLPKQATAYRFNTGMTNRVNLSLPESGFLNIYALTTSAGYLDTVNVNLEEEGDTIELPLNHYGALKIRLKSGGRGIVDVRAVLLEESESVYGHTGRSGAEGEILFPSLVPGVYRLSLNHDKYSWSDREVRVEPGSEFLVEINEDNKHQKKVFFKDSASGESLSTVQVDWEIHNFDGSEFSRSGSGKTDAEGKILLPVLPAGNLLFNARVKGYGESPLFLRAGVDDYYLTLKKEGVLRIRCVLPEDADSSSLHVTLKSVVNYRFLQNNEGRYYDTGILPVREGEEFVFHNLKSGVYVVQATGWGMESEEKAVEVYAGVEQSVELKIELRHRLKIQPWGYDPKVGSPLRVLLITKGETPARLKSPKDFVALQDYVTFMGEGQDYYERAFVIAVEMDSIGVYEADLPDELENFSHFRLQADGYMLSDPQSLSNVDGKESWHEVKMERGGIVRGVVLNPDGEPVDSAKVQVEAYSYSVTDKEGSFEMSGLEKELVSLKIAHPDYLDAEKAVRADGTRHTIRLEAGKQLSGIVLDANAEPVAGAVVILEKWIPFTATWEMNYDVSSDYKGRFSFKGLPSGRFRISASKADVVSPYKVFSLDDRQELPELELRLLGNKSLSVSVEDEQGDPLAFNPVYVVLLDDLISRHVRRLSMRGEVVFQDLAPGSYRIVVMDKEYNIPISEKVASVPGPAVSIRIEQGVEIPYELLDEQGNPVPVPPDLELQFFRNGLEILISKAEPGKVRLPSAKANEHWGKLRAKRKSSDLDWDNAEYISETFVPARLGENEKVSLKRRSKNLLKVNATQPGMGKFPALLMIDSRDGNHFMQNLEVNSGPFEIAHPGFRKKTDWRVSLLRTDNEHLLPLYIGVKDLFEKNELNIVVPKPCSITVVAPEVAEGEPAVSHEITISPIEHSWAAGVDTFGYIKNVTLNSGEEIQLKGLYPTLWQIRDEQGRLMHSIKLEEGESFKWPIKGQDSAGAAIEVSLTGKSFKQDDEPRVYLHRVFAHGDSVLGAYGLDAEGNTRIDNLSPGTYKVGVVTTALCETVQLKLGESRKITFRHTGESLRIRLMTPYGYPVPYARALILRGGTLKSAGRFIQENQVHESFLVSNGSYEVHATPGEVVDLLMQPLDPSYAQIAPVILYDVQVPVQGTYDMGDIIMKEGKSYAGKIVDTRYEPIVDATIFYCNSYGKVLNYGMPQRSIIGGKVLLQGAPDDGGIYVTANGYSPVYMPSIHENFQIVMKGGIDIDVHLEAESLAGSRAMLYAGSNSPLKEYGVQFVRQGNLVSFYDLPPGNYSIRVENTDMGSVFQSAVFFVSQDTQGKQIGIRIQPD